MSKTLTVCLLALMVGVALAVSPIHVPIKRREKSHAEHLGFMKALHMQRQGVFKLSSRFAASPVNLNLTNSLPQGSASYYGSVGLGSPAQVADYDFDTGSSNFWVANAQCSNCPATGYDHTKSSTYVANGEYLSISYGSGQVSGYLSQDTATIAGLKVPNVVFGEITSESVQPVGAPTVGLVGLAFRSISQDNDEPLLTYVYNAGLIPTNSFGMYLSTSESGIRQGQLTLGGVDRRLFKGQLTYTPITDDQWFVININGISLPGQTIASSTAVIVDSGTSCLAGPTAAVNNILNSINIGSDCTGLSSAPNITVNIAGVNLVMNPSDYTLQYQGQCQICIQGIDLPSSIPFQWILGDSFMHAYYVHFDKTGNRLGFAPSVPGS
jgi:hypothetical protein